MKPKWVLLWVSCIILGVVGCVGGVSPSAVEREATPAFDAVAPESPTATKTPPSEGVDWTTPAASRSDTNATPIPERGMRLTPSSLREPERAPTTEPAFVTGEVPAELLAAIHDDVVERSGAQREAIQIVRAEAVVWSDGSLGCPQPGMMYTQALVNGYWAVLQVDGKAYDYRLSAKGHFFLCESGVPRISVPGESGDGVSPNK